MPTELRLIYGRTTATGVLGNSHGRTTATGTGVLLLRVRAYYCYGYGRTTATGTGVLLLRVRAYYDYGYGRTTIEAFLYTTVINDRLQYNTVLYSYGLKVNLQ